MGGLKAEYPALLPPGFHGMTMAQLKALCVDGFARSDRRPKIYKGLEQLMLELSASGLKGEVWVDGSFVTKKLEPDDCDLVVKGDGGQLDYPTPSITAVLGQYFDDAKRPLVKATIYCDVYLFADYPALHTQYGASKSLAAYWEKEFGTSRTAGTKGIAVIALP